MGSAGRWGRVSCFAPLHALEADPERVHSHRDDLLSRHGRMVRPPHGKALKDAAEDLPGHLQGDRRLRLGEIEQAGLLGGQ